MNNSRPDFENTEIAFRHLSDQELWRAYGLFKTINIKPLVSIGPPLVSMAIKLHLPLKSLLKSTIFNHFCGGETLESCAASIKKLAQGRVRSILDYGVEGEKSEAGFDATVVELLRNISLTTGNQDVPFCVFKLTALARFEFLEQLSVPQTRANALATDEYERVLNRVKTVCSAAVKAGKLVMIDAEETWIQPAIDQLAVQMMQSHNAADCMVYTTVQMYRTDGLDNVTHLLDQSKAEGWKCGIKLVRGAYMEKERERALKQGYKNPIHPDKRSTDAAYDSALKQILDAPHASLCAGTHNSQSSQLTYELMDQLHLKVNDRRVWFAQLLGMSDDLTFNLADSGYNAAKYVPYGPVKAVLPYLFRRAQENTSIAGQSGRELLLVEKEIRRRGGK
jgi:proline dehydrogenase